ncbi:MAG: hypothetical protein K0S38_215 [Candidatus Paceibacter sp.]|jgi:hypothetical protein|nr:hypothetical protein [Candidatus Paceibacter sp.]
MPLLVDDMEQLSHEATILKQGKLPPLLSFIVTLVVFFIALGISVVYVFPLLRGVFHMNILFALLLSIGAFIVLNIALGELMAFIATRQKQKQLKSQA